MLHSASETTARACPFMSISFRASPPRTSALLLLILLSALAGAAPSFAGTKLPGEAPKAMTDKSQYHLFNPTPLNLMREMSTDRPDTTESAYTVDAGHYQIEMSFFDYSRDRSDGARTKT